MSSPLQVATGDITHQHGTGAPIPAFSMYSITRANNANVTQPTNAVNTAGEGLPTNYSQIGLDTINPYNAEATFVQSTGTLRFF